MKLVSKMVLAVVAAMVGVLVAYTPLSLDRYREQLREDMASDHRALVGVLVEAIEVVWERSGRDRAVALVDEVNVRKPEILISFSEELVEVSDTDVRQSIVEREDDRALLTEAAIVVKGRRVGSLHALESLGNETAAVRARLLPVILTAGAMIAAGTIVAMVLGRRLVGVPVERLAEQAERIGRGDVTARLHLPGRDELAHLAGVMNTMADRLLAASETAEAEARARETALEQLRHADRLTTVGKLAAGVAHELGTPLNVVSLRAQQLTRGEAAPDEIAPLSAQMLEQARRMDAIIRQLLNFARVSKPERARVDLVRVAQRTVELVEPIAHGRRISLDLVSPPRGVFATVDPDQVQQALTNLVVNAVQASDQGDAVTISVSREHALDPSSREARDVIAIAVRDRGEGIAPEHVPHVFEPFFSTKDVGAGTGLGLSVAYGIVREHSGWIDVSTRLGAGCVFTVYLPDDQETSE